MRILDLPLELIQDILHKAIQVRGLRRGVRLRLVNSRYLYSFAHGLLLTHT